MQVLQTARQLIPLSLTDWISDSRFQGCTGSQSLVERLDHTDTVWHCNHARLLYVVQCIEMHLGGYLYNHGK